MQIFFVRHGETSGNVARRHQAENTPLSTAGEKQVRATAAKIKALKPTHLITSTLVRAVETASVLGQECDLIPETNEMFVELVRPDYLYGNHHRSFKSLWFYFRWYFGIGTDKVGGGESYKDLRERIKKAQDYLTEFSDDARVVVVSHAVFINMFAAHACRTRALTPIKAALTFSKILTMSNAEITAVVHDLSPKSESCAWSVDR